MNASIPKAAALALVIASFSATAQTAAEHEQHHPGATAPTTAASPVNPEQQASAMDRHLQAMRDMNRRMAEGKTPQERQALMAEHRQVMQDSMKLMGQMQAMPKAGMGAMGGAGTQGGMGPQMMGQMMQRHALMEKRMEMMESMMQMMIDQMGASSPK